MYDLCLVFHFEIEPLLATVKEFGAFSIENPIEVWIFLSKQTCIPYTECANNLIRVTRFPGELITFDTSQKIL